MTLKEFKSLSSGELVRFSKPPGNSSFWEFAFGNFQSVPCFDQIFVIISTKENSNKEMSSMIVQFISKNLTVSNGLIDESMTETISILEKV